MGNRVSEFFLNKEVEQNVFYRLYLQMYLPIVTASPVVIRRRLILRLCTSRVGWQIMWLHPTPL